MSGALYLDKQEDVDDYTVVMSELSVQAEPAGNTESLLHAILREL